MVRGTWSSGIGDGAPDRVAAEPWPRPWVFRLSVRPPVSLLSESRIGTYRLVQ